MTKAQLEKFFNYLKKSRAVFGPVKVKLDEFDETQVLIREIEDFNDLILDSGLPFYPFKNFFVPECEMLFEYKGIELEKKREIEGNIAIFGINILDLKSILLYDQVFEKDPYFQIRRQNTLVIGHNIIPDLPQNIFEETFEEDILEHLSFDIFLGALSAPITPLSGVGASNTSGVQEFKVFTGSGLGQKILDEFGYHDYVHIQFSGPVKEGKLDERMLKLKDKLENKHNQKIWEDLGKRCIECGKCTIVCPTCFCFRIDDQAELGPSRAQRGDKADNYGTRNRCWDVCFYQEFSEVAGGPSTHSTTAQGGEQSRTTGSGQGYKFLKNTADRIHFWYFHKFARIPKEFNFMGCVGCHRCAVVCPVGIDIVEVLKDIENS